MINSLRPFSVFFIILCLALFPKRLVAVESPVVGRVVMTRGDVKLSRAGNPDELFLLRGDFVYEKDVITTSHGSVVKVEFTENGSMILGPNSVVHLQKFSKNKPGLINLLKGQLRSHVNKREVQNLPTREKFLLRTNNSALGVRGTDFELNYDPNNKSSKLVVHRGLVAMSPFFRRKIDVDTLLDHLKFSSSVKEIPAGHGMGVNRTGEFLFEVKGLSFIKPKTTFQNKVTNSKKTTQRQKEDNVEHALRNGRNNAHGSLKNGTTK